MSEQHFNLAQSEKGRYFLSKYQQGLEQIRRQVIGLDDVIEDIFIAMLADGHVILEGEPGVGKTLVARTVSRTVDVPCSYIQFTPETMPSDLFYAMDLFSQGKEAAEGLSMVRGPIFSPIVIGDEINRAIPRIHGALLSPLEEKIISLEGEVHELGPFYFWIATQNPVESSETTGQLPEALQERFMLMVRVPYPSPQQLRLITVHDARPQEITPVFSENDIVSIREEIYLHYILHHRPDSPVIDYIQRLVDTVHNHPVVRYGPGIRAAQDLARTASAHAFLHGRGRIGFDDIKTMAKPVLRFKFQCDAREMRKYHGKLANNDGVLSEILASVPIV